MRYFLHVGIVISAVSNKSGCPFSANKKVYDDNSLNALIPEWP
jgi:hypothetical protein